MFNGLDVKMNKTVLYANGYRFVLNKAFTLYNLLLRDITIITRLTADKKTTELSLSCEFSTLDSRGESNPGCFVYDGIFHYVDKALVNKTSIVLDLVKYNNKPGLLPPGLVPSLFGKSIVSEEDYEEFKDLFRAKLLETLKEAIRSHKLMLSDSILNFFGIEVSQEDIVMAVFSKPEVKITEMEEVTELSKEEEALKYSQDYNNYELLKATGLIDSNLSFEEFSSKIAKTLEEVKRDEAFDISLYNLLIGYKNTLNSYGSDTPREQVISDFRKLVQQVDLDKLLEE